MSHDEQEFGPIEFVDRPSSSRRKWAIDPILHKLRDVLPGGAQAGRAVRVPIASGQNISKIHMALRHAVTTQLHAQFHFARTADGALLVWAEKTP